MSYKDPPDWQEILTYFRGSELQNYFTKILEDDLKAIVKPQYVDQIPRTVKVSSRPSYNWWFIGLLMVYDLEFPKSCFGCIYWAFFIEGIINVGDIAVKMGDI